MALRRSPISWRGPAPGVLWTPRTPRSSATPVRGPARSRRRSPCWPTAWRRPSGCWTIPRHNRCAMPLSTSSSSAFRPASWQKRPSRWPRWIGFGRNSCGCWAACTTTALTIRSRPVVSRRSGTRRPRRDIRIAVAGTRRPLAPRAVRRVVGAVLDGEGTGDAAFSVTFLGAGRMRALNRRTFGRDRVTDVIAFELPHAGRWGGDLYVCPPAARAAVAAGGPLAEGFVRLLVHGTLHTSEED